MSKITDVGENKRLKLNNVRKVLAGTVDYLKDVVGMQLTQFPLPDTNKVKVVMTTFKYMYHKISKA